MTIYLYVKTHRVTGLKYLGKTTKDPYKYKGSGVYWLNHIKFHGYDVDTIIVKICSSVEELISWGKYYSNLWNVVEDKSWANLKPEEGDGWGTGEYNIMNVPTVKEKHLARINSPDIKQKHKQAMIDLYKNPEYRASRVELNTSKSDQKIYTFYHEDGTTVNCTRIELIKRFNLPSGHISNMIHEPRRRVKGWRVKCQSAG